MIKQQTVMQELLEWVRKTLPMDLDFPIMIEDKIKSLLEKEKGQIIEQTLGTITFTKEYFIKIIGQLKLQYDHDRKCSDAFSVILPDDYVSGYDNHILSSQLIEILKIAMDDNTKDSWIEYWIYELDYGKEYKEGCITDNGANVPLKTASDLWDMLIKNK